MSMPRSVSSHHIASGSSSTLSHYASALEPSSSTPHLSHLRQSSSIGFNLHHHASMYEEHPHYPTSASAYDVYEEIGVGAFATVYHAAVRETGEQVAIKVIDLDQFNTNWEEIRREIMTMSLVHHPNVVHILASFVEEQDLWIVMRLMQAGSCAHIMKTLYPTGMKDEAMIATILKEVLLGLLYFHKDGRLHRDLKAGNVLISGQGEVQLADFGVAGTLMENGDRKKARRTFTGTPCWMAPEVMSNSENGYDERADIWSFGITALELAYGRAPYAKFPPMKVMVLTLQEEPPTPEIYKDHSYEFSRHFESMVSKCLRKDPTKRPNVKKLLEHKFFKAAKDRQYLVEKIVKRMPPKVIPPNARLLNLTQVRHHHPSTGGDGDEQDDRPISVGSWVFDKAEFDEMKRQALEAKESAGPDGQRGLAVQASYEEETPRHGANNSAAAARPKGLPAARSSINLGVPAPSIPVRATSAQSADSASTSTDDGDDTHDDDAGHRPLPDFSDPNEPYEQHYQQYQHEQQYQQQHQQQNGVSTPIASYNDQSYAAAAAAGIARVQVTSPGGHHDVPAPYPSVTSPNEHQEGRFRVSDDQEEEVEHHFVDEPSQSQTHANYPPTQQQGDQQGEGEFHNDFCDDGQELSSTDQQHHAPHHVGRFAVMDDEQDEN